jgi:aminoglycoside phosphotransferase (APT) family kinase protein
VGISQSTWKAFARHCTPGGQSNLTFLLETGDARYVLRKKPSGNLLPSAHMIEREYRVTYALSTTGVPVVRSSKGASFVTRHCRA